jgi:tetratricopeptide (TPR) repeat protein
MTATLTGDWKTAAEAFRAAVKLQPGIAELHCNLGAALQHLGRHDEAVTACRRAASLKPGYSEAHFNLGGALLALGKAADAAAALEAAIAIRPDYAEAWSNLANARLAAGDVSAAEQAARRAVESRPGLADAHCSLGVALFRQGRRDEALACYRQATALRPDYLEAHCNIADTLLDQGQWADAEVVCRHAARLHPKAPVPPNNLGIALREQGRLEDAMAAFCQAIDVKGDFAPALANLGDSLRDLGRFDDAAEACKRAVAADRKCAAAHDTLGVALQALGRLDEAAACFERAVKLAPDQPRLRLNRGIAALLAGDLKRGWEGFEARPQPELPLPRWQGEDPAGKTILLAAEQGYGDTIQFARFAPLLAAKGAKVVLRVQPPLKSLLGGMSEDEPLPACDAYLPLLSLPALLGTDSLDAIPAATSYLTADPSRWQARLQALPGRKVGIAWAGAAHSPRYAAIDRRRSLSPEQLAPLVAVPGVSLVGLQKDAPAPASIAGWMDEAEDFAATAALIAGLDLVISVDTAVAHLAGALGKPVWLLSRFDGCWRWLRDREDSPWYPTLRLFRQPAPGDWDAVIGRVAEELAALR